jgi:carbamoyltransferase
MIVLGVNAYHGDVSAALLRDGDLVAAVEEERFRRVKHWAGFPRDAIRACLDMAGVTPKEVDHFAISRNPRANLLRKALFMLKNRPSISLLRDRVKNASRVEDVASRLGEALGARGEEIKAKIHWV